MKQTKLIVIGNVLLVGILGAFLISFASEPKLTDWQEFRKGQATAQTTQDSIYMVVTDNPCICDYLVTKYRPGRWITTTAEDNKGNIQIDYTMFLPVAKKKDIIEYLSAEL